MKQNILYFFIVVGLLSFVAVSCSREEEIPMDDSFALILQTAISSPATKAEVASETSLKEDAVDLLNVYFYGTFSGNVSPTLKHYSLSSATDKTGATSWKVSSDWRSEGFVAGNSYDVYVSANSKQVKTATTSNDKAVATGTLASASASITDLAGLKSMIEFDYNPAEANGEGGHKPYWGAYDEDNLNPEWLDLHKKYIPKATFVVSTGNSQQKRYYANEKTFLMDGKTTFTAGSTEAIPLELVRAAAKVVVDVKFDDAFLTSLEAKHVTVSGAPAWRFYNFSFSTPVIDPSLITGAAVNYNKSIFVAGGIMMGKSPEDSHLVYTGADKHFSFVTYTYPFSWTAGSASSEAPAIILSLGYTDSTDPYNPVTTYQTYKIPVVDPKGGVLEIGRNKLYRVQATIASEGGELLTDAYKVRCNYDIIPWGDIPVNSEDIADVDHSDNDYFDVSPTSLILRGNGLQIENLNIIKPNKRSYKLKYCSNVAGATEANPFPNPAGADTWNEYSFTENVAENAPAPYYFNYDGAKRNAFADTKEAGGITYGTSTYLQNKFVRGDKTLQVNSYALPNMAIKYMKVRVYLDVTGWESKGLYKDITIVHYPTNYISSKKASWASRISAVTFLDPSHAAYEAFTESMRGPEEYAMSETDSYDRAVYLSWNESTREIVGYENCTEEQYNTGKAGSYPDDYRSVTVTTTYSVYSSNSSNPLYTRTVEEGRHLHNEGTPPVMGNGNRTQNKTKYNSESNARDGNDGWYYWGEGTAISVGSTTQSKQSSLSLTEINFDVPTSFTDPYDYYTVNITSSGGWNKTYTATFTFYEYPTHKRAQYTKPQYQRMKFADVTYAPNPTYITTPANFSNARQRYWVNWDIHQGHAANNTTYAYRTSSDATNTDETKNIFEARVYDTVNSKSLRITTSGTSRDDNLSRGNNHLYIVRTAEPNSNIVLGRPNMDNHGFSFDKVTSPAFMVASQVGSTRGTLGTGTSSTTTPGFGAYNVSTDLERYYWTARHCATYLEVGDDGTYYKNWRLPTPDEIKLLTNIQGVRPTGSGTTTTVTLNGITFTGDDRPIDIVMNAGYYYASDRTTPRAHITYTTVGIRCVRDLTQAEIDALNN